MLLTTSPPGGIEEIRYSIQITTRRSFSLNPLRAGITKSIDEYPWSSLPDYLGQRKKELKQLNIIKVSQAFNLTKKSVLKKQRGNLYRQIALYLVKNYSSLPLKEISKIFDMDYTAVSQRVRRIENSIKKDDKIRKKLESVLELLHSNEC